MLTKVALLLSEMLNLCFLSFGIYGMFKSIEIQHPLYAALYLNLLIALVTSVINLLAYPFIDVYLRFSNSLNCLALFFHMGCWLITSIIRYVYLIHSDWLYSKIPSVKTQCFVTLTFEIILSWILMAPVLGIMLKLGKLLFLISCFKNLSECYVAVHRLKTSNLQGW